MGRGRNITNKFIIIGFCVTALFLIIGIAAQKFM